MFYFVIKFFMNMFRFMLLGCNLCRCLLLMLGFFFNVYFNVRFLDLEVILIYIFMIECFVVLVNLFDKNLLVEMIFIYVGLFRFFGL